MDATATDVSGFLARLQVQQRPRRGLLAAAAAAIPLLPGVTFAQTPPPRPDSGQILQELDKAPTLQKPRGQSPARPDVAVRDTKLSPDAQLGPQTRVDVRGYQLSGNTAFPDEELLQLVSGQVGSRTIDELEQIASRITRYYRERGYLVARAYLPYQEIHSGIVRLDILEGRYGEIIVDNKSSIDDRRVRETVERSACGASTGCAGQLIREVSLERGMLGLTDLPGIRARGELQPGREIGTSNVLITVEPARRFTGAVEATNHGGRYVGRERAAVTAGYANPFGIGDQVNFQGAYSSGSTYASLGYDVPLGYRSTRLFFSGYRMDYELEKDFRALGAEGNTVGGEIGVVHSFFRDSRRSLSARATFDYKSIEDDVAVAQTSNRRKAMSYEAQVDGALNDGWLSQIAFNRLSLAYTAGKLDIHDPLSAAIDAATASTDGHFSKIVYWISRTQQLSERWSVALKLSGQFAGENLDSSEKFYLGGPGAVRAYPVGEAAGDRGYLASAELRRLFFGPFNGTTQLSAFYDRGRVRIDAEPWIGNATSRTLDGVGVGVDWSQQRGWTLAITAAVRGSEKVKSAPDRDYQLWMSGGYRY